MSLGYRREKSLPCFFDNFLFFTRKTTTQIWELDRAPPSGHNLHFHSSLIYRFNRLSNMKKKIKYAFHLGYHNFIIFLSILIVVAKGCKMGAERKCTLDGIE